MPNVYNVFASIEVERDNLSTMLDQIDTHDDIAEIVMDETNVLKLKSSASEHIDVNKYVPTAQLKARLETKRPKEVTGGQWKPPETTYGEEATFARFHGTDDEVLQNSKLNYPMFLVLKELALLADGDLTAVVCDDGEITPVYIEDGEDKSGKAEVTVRIA